MNSESQPQDSQIFTLPNGRKLGYAIYGPPPSPGKPTILYFHGFPTTRIEGSFCASTRLKPHVVAIDRPGMGLSSFQPSRRIVDWPSDVLALTEHLKIEKFHIIGASGGSPYALVCAKEISRQKLLSVSVVSGIYPLSLGTQGMLFGPRVFLHSARKEDPQEFEDLFMKEMEAMLERDKRCLDDLEFRRIMAQSMREAFRQGAQGPAWDCRLYSDWGFELEEVDGRNIVLWHGKEDANAPFAMAEKAARLIDGCSLRVVEGEAHMSLSFHHIDEILQALVDLGLD